MGRAPNVRLRSLLDEARWNGAELARAVNATAVEAGVRTGYGRASVANWLAGSRPRGKVPELIAEALSRRLGRTVTASDTGFGHNGEPVRRRTHHGQDELGRGADRVPAGSAVSRAPGVYSVAGLDVPRWAQVLPADRERPRAPRGPWRLSGTELDAATTMLTAFSRAERACGAGPVRAALTEYLETTIHPLLGAVGATSAVRRSFLSVAARLRYLCGFLYFDDELHGAGQWHYRSALQLAVEAGDPTTYAIALRALSVQARALGHHRESVRLAEGAVEAGTVRAVPEVRAFLVGQLAVARATLGERRAAVAHLCEAERIVERMSGGMAAVGAYHRAALAHQRAAVAAGLGDRAGAMTALEDSIRHRPSTELRSRAVLLAKLAELRLDAGQVEQAGEIWHRFLDDYPVVRSGRVDTALRTLRSRLLPHRKLPGVEELLGRASAVRAGGG
ncbi:hypothetical protein [Amycolatopsis aidingensis]|uniref:hypothetical protein n=1 Tax=Amycolatopsis aidingensis TaxID=2842453 RepID=UPI001C0BE076|nr:hypothetical protein [Amycolatopsis aidingensis]